MRIRVCPFGAKKKPSHSAYWEQVKALKFSNSIQDVNAIQLQKFLSEGHAVIFASYPKKSEQIKLEGIEEKVTTKLLALDIDSKENPITKEEMINKLFKDLEIYPALAYNTFSDVNNSKFSIFFPLL